jgi:hypothetical protein
MSARTDELEAAYQLAKERGELQALNQIPPIEEWFYWNRVINKFKHDKFYIVHEMLVLKRKPRTYWELTNYEILELFRDIFPELDQRGYHDIFKGNFKPMRSVDDYFHIHIATYIEEYR